MNGNVTLIVGVGSDHGDDRLGWHVARWLEPRVGPDVTIRTARAPIQILDWLAGVKRLVVIDACHGDGPLGRVYRWNWPDVPCQSGVFAGTHDLGLVDVLRLADELRSLPPETVLFAATTSGPSATAGFETPLSADTAAASEELAARILCELGQCNSLSDPTPA